MKKKLLIFLSSTLFLVGCNSGSGNGDNKSIGNSAKTQEVTGNLEFYRKVFYKKVDSCPAEPVIHHQFLTIEPVMLPDEEYGQKTFATSELYISEDGTYGLRYQEMAVPKTVEEADLPPLWHTRREGKWFINGTGQLVLENLGTLEPDSSVENTGVSFTYTNAVTTDAVVGKSASTRMYDSIIGLNDELLMCE